MKVIWSIVGLLLVCLPLASAATISGGIYDHEFRSVDNVILYVNSTPLQTIVSRYGGYQFEVDSGTYHITVNYTKNGITKTIAEDYIDINDQDGTYRRDLFVFSDVDLINDFNVSVIEQQQLEERNRKLIAFASGGVIIVSVAILAFFLIRRRSKPVGVVEADDIVKDKIVSLLKERKGQATQKYIRQQLPLSESKISMLLSDLEKEGHVEKVKNGRVNMIVLKK